MPIFSAIVAMSRNRVIGRDNQLPWRLPADLQHFKKLTLNHSIVMGKKTFLSIGKSLPNRKNIILTRDKCFTVANCFVVHSVAEALKVADGDEVFVIGGGEIYREFWELLDRIYVTVVEAEIEGDVFFPEILGFEEVGRECVAADESNAFAMIFLTFVRGGRP